MLVSCNTLTRRGGFFYELNIGMVTRIMAVGPGRLNEAACALSFDYNFVQPIDRTYIIAPFGKKFFLDIFERLEIDINLIEFVQDQDLIESAKLHKWAHNTWYLQQALKLSLLDQLNVEQFIIQDCDVFPIKPYDLFPSGVPNLRVELVLNDEHPIRVQQAIYENYVHKVIGLSRPNNLTFVSEVMPITKSIWVSCSEAIEKHTGLNWREAVPNTYEFDDTKWFSEYELLGFYMLHNINNIVYNVDIHPIINSWNDFHHGDWSNTTIVKTGKFRPLKFMSLEEVVKVREYFKTKNLS